MRQTEIILCSVFGELNVGKVEYDENIILTASEYANCSFEDKDDFKRMALVNELKPKTRLALESTDEYGRKNTVVFNLMMAILGDIRKIRDNNASKSDRYQVPVESLTIDHIELSDGARPMVRIIWTFEDVGHGGGERYLFGTVYYMDEDVDKRERFGKVFNVNPFTLGFHIPW